MAGSDATFDSERNELVALLQVLSQDRGVRREDLITLLHERLHKLAQCWTLNLNDDHAIVRRNIAEALNQHIQVMQPRWGESLINNEHKAARRRRITAVGFNITSYIEIYKKGLEARWEWLDKDCRPDLQVRVGTSRRIFRESIGEIAERMINAGAAVGVPSKPEAALLPSSPRPAPRSSSSFAHLVDLSGELKHALYSARDACETQNRSFYTSDLLVALLDLPGGRVARCFDEAVRLGQAASIRQQLAATLGPDRHHEPFVPFGWLERPDVQLAAEYAISDSRLVVSELHLLLAVLDGDSATNRWLQRLLGEKYPQVRAVAERHRRDGPTVVNSPTPDGLR